MAELRTFKTYGIVTDDGDHARVGDMVWVVDMVKYDSQDDIMPCDFFGGLVEDVEDWGADVKAGRFNNKTINMSLEPKDYVFRSKEKAEEFLKKKWAELEKKQAAQLQAIQEKIAFLKEHKARFQESQKRQKTEEQLWAELEEAQARLRKAAESP